MTWRLKPLFLVLPVFLPFSCATPPDQVVLAKVGSEKIRTAELKKAFEEQKGLYGEDILADPKGNFAVRKKVLNGLIEESLLLQAAAEKEIALTPEEEKSLGDQLRSGYSEGEFEKILSEKKI